MAADPKEQPPSNDNAPAISEEAKDEVISKFKHLMRPCKVYRGEYKECKRWKGRFNQYFIFGEMLDCQGWADTYNNCQKYSWRGNKDAAIDVIKSELTRYENRMRPHLENDVWAKREQPPDDWSQPLPKFMVERNHGSYLDIQLKKMAAETTYDSDGTATKKFCTFM